MLIDTCIRCFPLATIQYQRPIGKPGLVGGLQKQLIQAIKAGPEPLDDELFLAIFEIEDTIEQQKFIEAARAKCREQKKLTEFNNMLRAWTSKNAQNQKQQGSNKTRFTYSTMLSFW